MNENPEDDLYYVRRLANYIGAKNLIFTREKKIYLLQGGQLRTIEPSELENLGEAIL